MCSTSSPNGVKECKIHILYSLGLKAQHREEEKWIRKISLHHKTYFLGDMFTNEIYSFQRNLNFVCEVDFILENKQYKLPCLYEYINNKIIFKTEPQMKID